MTETLLRVQDLEVAYPRPRGGVLRAVNKVSFELPQGGTLGIVGESGCGKSSLARAILQLERYRGEVTLLGNNLGALSARELRASRRHMQAVFQDPLASLNPRMTVLRLIEEPLRVHCPELDETQRRERVLNTLKRIGMEQDVIASYPHELSGGQCQRIGIARAIICEPKLVICDEPVSALDTSVRGQILGLLESLRRELGIGLIFIAHDMTAVRYLCDQVMVMYAGKVVEFAPRDAVFDSPAHPYTRTLLQAVLPPDPDGQPPRDETVDIPRDEKPSIGCCYAPRCAFAIDVCKQEAPSLRTAGDADVACHRAGEI